MIHYTGCISSAKSLVIEVLLLNPVERHQLNRCYNRNLENLKLRIAVSSQKQKWYTVTLHALCSSFIVTAANYMLEENK